MKRLGISLAIFGCVWGAIDSTFAMFWSSGADIYRFELSAIAFITALGFVLYQLGKDLDKEKP